MSSTNQTKYYKITQRLENRKGVKFIETFLTDRIEPLFEVVSQEEITKETFFEFILNNLRKGEVEHCKQNNFTLNESFNRQDGAAYTYFWQYGVEEQEAQTIFKKVKEELEAEPKVFASNPKRTWGEYFYKGYVPQDLQICSKEEMVSDDIL